MHNSTEIGALFDSAINSGSSVDVSGSGGASLATIGQIGRNADQGLPAQQPIDFAIDSWNADASTLDVAALLSDISTPFLAQTSARDFGPDYANLSDDLLGNGALGVLGGLFGEAGSSAQATAKVQSALQDAIAQLKSLAAGSDSALVTQLQQTLGDTWNAAAIGQAIANITSGSAGLSIALLPTAVLQSRGAFAAESNTVYLAEDWVKEQSVGAIFDVLLEELGHAIDDQINPISDTPGDEGAIFSALVQGKQLTAETLLALQSEDDQGQIVLGGQTIDVEQATLSQSQLNRSVGAFHTGRDGSFKFDFLFDGSPRQGQLGAFSLKGMGGLSKAAFIKEATKRVLSNGSKGRIVIDDRREGAQFSGRLGGNSFNRGKRAGTKNVKLERGKFAFMLVPRGTFAAMKAGRRQTPLFSIAAFNPGGKAQIGKAAPGIFAMEDVSLTKKTDSDFNDIVFRVRGASERVTNLSRLISQKRNWLKNPQQPFLKGPQFSNPNTPQKPVANPLPKDKPTPAPNPVSNPAPPKPVPEPVVVPDPVPDPVVVPKPVPKPVAEPSGKAVSDISNNVSKFYRGFSEAQIAATGAQRIKIGSQTIYIGTQQVTSLNQNPIISSFDAKNPANNWTRTDYETSGTDGRGLGLLWTGKDLYGFFSVDGTQDTPSQDFRRAAGGASQEWLRSYGRGGGTRIGVIGKIDPATGKLQKAAHLSAVLGNGQSNSLSVTGATVNGAGNVVIQAKSFFNPRRPDGSPLKKNAGNNAGSPFDYTIEINRDLTRVLKTSAPGWS